MRVSIVGLGTVGMALSQRLLRAGYEVAGWHQDPRRVHAFADMGGTPVVLSPGPSSEPRNSPCT
jgi:3-hydroxyisobutyrate dehydrogenase-like beta-hydroxyacid dehydrogenase